MRSAVAAEAFERLHRNAVAESYRGWEFSDFLESPVARAFHFNIHFLKRLWVQFGNRSPFNVHRGLAVPKLDSTKGRGFFAKGYLYMHQATGEARWREAAVGCLEWLLANPSPGHPGLGWGNHFDYANRGGWFPALLPTIVWTGHMAEVFDLAHEATGEPRWLEALRGCGEFILQALERHEDADGLCFAYSPGRLNLVHNSNLLGAAALLRCRRHFGDEVYRSTARRAYQWSLAHMTDEGGWPYGVGDSYAWIDNFHTAYVIDSLMAGHDMDGESTVPWPAIERSWRFWVERFFLPDGTPRYYHDRTMPIDIQCGAQAIETFAKWANRFEEAAEMSTRVLEWTLTHMKKSNGAFRYQIRRGWRNDVEFFFWGQATMAAALGAWTRFIGSNRPGESPSA